MADPEQALGPADYQAKRLEAGLTFAELERRTGYSRSHISRVEAGHHNPSPAYEASFLSALKGRPGDQADRQNTAERAKQLFARFARRMETGQDALERARKALNAALSDMQSAAVQSDILAGKYAGYDPDSFDPVVASDEQVSVLDSAIIGVVVEILTDHRIHTLDEESIRNYVRHIGESLQREILREKAKLDQTNLVKAVNRARTT